MLPHSSYFASSNSGSRHRIPNKTTASLALHMTISKSLDGIENENYKTAK